MDRKSDYFKPKALNIAEQIVAMSFDFLQFKQHEVSHNHVVWVGTLQPTPLSEVYTVKIEYSGERRISVRVLSPKLEKRGAERIPHMYNQERLCLFYPRSGEWDKTMYISRTIVPWTCTWLYYYEMWHATGEWLGGGIHPPMPQARKYRSVKKLRKAEQG